MNKKSGMVLLGGIVLAAAAHAATTNVQSNVIGLTFTNWDSLLVLPKFDPSLGTLNSASLSFFGDVVIAAEAESRDAAAATLTLNLAAQLSLTRPDGLAMILTPATSRTFAATAYDGVRDFAGTSGITYPNVAVSAGDSVSFTEAALLAPFIGTDSLTLAVRALGSSSATGAGNLVAAFETQAGARASVVYDYTAAANPEGPVAAVPEPETYALMALGLAWVSVVTRRRKR